MLLGALHMIASNFQFANPTEVVEVHWVFLWLVWVVGLSPSLSYMSVNERTWVARLTPAFYSFFVRIGACIFLYDFRSFSLRTIHV